MVIVKRFTFTPATGYHIVSVFIDGNHLHPQVHTLFPLLLEHLTNSATFAIDVFTVTVGDHTHGSISSANGTSVNYGNDLSFSVTPDTGYHLVSVLIDGETATAPYTLSPLLQLTLSAQPLRLIPSQSLFPRVIMELLAPATTTVNYGGSQEFTFTPATGYHITLQSQSTEPQYATRKSYTVSTVTGATSLTAEFAINTYAITVLRVIMERLQQPL